MNLNAYTKAQLVRETLLRLSDEDVKSQAMLAGVATHRSREAIIDAIVQRVGSSSSSSSSSSGSSSTESGRRNPRRSHRSSGKGRSTRLTSSYPPFVNAEGNKRGTLEQARCYGKPLAVRDHPANAPPRKLKCGKRGAGDAPTMSLLLVDPTNADGVAAMAAALNADVEVLALFNVVDERTGENAHFETFRRALPEEQHVLIYAAPAIGLAGAYNRLMLASNAPYCILAGAGVPTEQARPFATFVDAARRAFQRVDAAGALFARGIGGAVVVRRSAVIESGGFAGDGCAFDAERTCAFSLERGLADSIRSRGWIVSHVPHDAPPGLALRPSGACPSAADAADVRDASLLEALESRTPHAPTCGAKGSAYLSSKVLEARLGGRCQPRWAVALQYFRRASAIPELAAPLVEHDASALEVLVHNDGGSEHAEWLEALAGVVKNGGRVWHVHSIDVHEIRGYNRLVRLSAATLIALVQDDDVPRALHKTLEEASTLFRVHPSLTLLGGWRGRIDVDGAPFNRQTNQLDSHKFGPGLKTIPYWDDAARCPFMFAARVNAAPLFAKRRILLQLGLLRWDLSCPGSAGIGFDFEYSLRAWHHGYRVGLFYSRYRHNAVKDALHSGTRTNTEAWLRRKEQERMNNRRLYELYPGFYHKEATALAEEANSKLRSSNYDLSEFVESGDFASWKHKPKTSGGAGVDLSDV